MNVKKRGEFEEIELMKLGKKVGSEQRKHVDLVGIDFSTTATKLVRLKKNKDGLELAGIDLLPAVDFKQPAQSLDLSRDMKTNYGCVAYSAPTSVARVVNVQLPGEDEKLPDSKLREALNIGDDFRVAAALVRKGKGRQDSSFLAVAIPDDDVHFILNMFPAGPPAPASLEVSGLALIPAFMHARDEEIRDEAVCLIEAGESVSHFAFIVKGAITLVGKYDFGGRVLRARVAKDLGVDDELAANILQDTSINISGAMSDVMGPFLKQLSISKDFIERHQACRIGSVYVSGGMGLLPNVTGVIEHTLHAEARLWSPFEKIQYEPDAIPEHLTNQLTRFAAATGAAIGGLELP